VTNMEKKDDLADLEELMTRGTRSVVFGGLAAIIIIGAVVLALWALNGTQPTWP
jgi:hypothetical protein